MSVKLMLYVFTTILSVYMLDSLNINHLFKKNRILEAKIVYILFSMAISYLVTNYIYDFINLI